jgi:ABC-type transport system involved in multi-copper enzyme maturation permease subunit
MNSSHPIFLAFDFPAFVNENLNWIVGGLIVLIGLFVIGFKDVIRFRFRRVWAISGVCFDESIRRRILWITPLAILGVIIVAQLQKPNDEQDAIRQTTKFCLFATGFVVTVSTVILACTNLPREIENRVIYTVVTKPTTRLEIVLGKILGFARVSAAILIIMGLFTYGYLWLRASSMTRAIQYRLDNGAVDPMSVPTLKHYQEGLLNAKTFASSQGFGIYARVPPIGAGRRYFDEGSALIPFVLPQDTAIVTDSGGKSSTEPAMVIRGRIGFERTTPATPAVAASTQPLAPPQVIVQIFDSNYNSLVTSEINGGKPVTLSSADGTNFQVPVAASALTTLSKTPYFYVAFLAGTGNVQYWIDSQPAQVIVPVGSKPDFQTLYPTNPIDPTKPAEILFIGRQGLDGQQVRGDTLAKAPVAVFPFRNVSIGDNSTKPLPFEMRMSIEKGDSESTDVETPTRVTLAVRNIKTGQIVDAGEIAPESNRPAYGDLPPAAVAGGDFDIIVRCLSPQRWLGVKADSIAVVEGQSTFAFNLIKSLVIIWLLTVLVISIAIFCSTFLSWPIAIVLTLLILLSHWGLQQLGDAAEAGLGRQFVQDFNVRDPAQAQAISATVEQLNKFLKAVSTVLPDIDRFSATEDIERGISIPPEKLWDALLAMGAFGIPLSVLAYVFLKNKEVAP